MVPDGLSFFCVQVSEAVSILTTWRKSLYWAFFANTSRSQY